MTLDGRSGWKRKRKRTEEFSNANRMRSLAKQLKFIASCTAQKLHSSTSSGYLQAMPTFAELRAKAVRCHTPASTISLLTHCLPSSRNPLLLLPKTNLNHSRSHLPRPSTLHRDHPCQVPRSLLQPLFANLLPSLLRLPHKLSDLLLVALYRQRRRVHLVEQCLYHLLTNRQSLNSRNVRVLLLRSFLLDPPRR